MADNTVTTDNKNDKILLLESAGSLTFDDIISLMKKEDTGLRQETLEHVLKLFNRVSADALLSGYSINTGLFRGVPQFRGVVEGGQWDPEKNSIYVLFTQDKELREAIAQTSVNILGEKGNAMYIIGVEDAAMHVTDDLVTVNNPSQLILLLPYDLKPGEYTLRVTTQYSGGGKSHGTPRSTVKVLVVLPGK